MPKAKLIPSPIKMLIVEAVETGRTQEDVGRSVLCISACRIEHLFPLETRKDRQKTAKIGKTAETNES